MPGVLIVEAIAQAGGALLLTEVEDRSDKVMMFTGIDRAKFRRPVSPGDQLRLEVEVTGWRSVPGMTAAKMQGYAYVGETTRGRGDRFLPVGGQLARARIGTAGMAMRDSDRTGARSTPRTTP